ncbi:hypothetical protein GC105_07600 [Alkalibaculum sp. M08DMB]|uniref:Uncharacterized protein n=1 Tax=Alkalibaculum sporogenes TaxID=2655001 RepID=A0A6A7K8E2_9FIRM|nr:hypothetical protein [Alkalibaculum sporogenes]MPW25652.1 hypothetical protein [Alkalibaculum sporogenes]
MKRLIGFLVVLSVLGVIGWKVYPYIVVGIDYLNGDEPGITNENGLGETIKQYVESGEILSDEKSVKALNNISEDLTKARESLSTEQQKEVVTLAQQAIDSTLNNEGDYKEKIDQLMDAYRGLPSDEQQNIQFSIGKSINMRDYLTLKEKLEE